MRVIDDVQMARPTNSRDGSQIVSSDTRVWRTCVSSWSRGEVQQTLTSLGTTSDRSQVCGPPCADPSCHWLDLGRCQSCFLSETISRRHEVESGRAVRVPRLVGASTKNRNTPDNLSDEAAFVLAAPNKQRIVPGQSVRNFACSDETLRSTETHQVAEHVRFSLRSELEYTTHTTNDRGSWGAVEKDDEDRMRAFLDRHVPRRPAPVLTGGGSAEPAVVEPAEILVGTAGAASTSNSGGAALGD